jgi:hypothetical protein
MPKKNNEDLQQTLLNKGIEIVLSAFNEQKKEFKKTIYELEKENSKLKEENNIYKNKLSILHKKLSKISKTFCDIDIEDEETKVQANENINNNNNNYVKETGKNTCPNRKSILYKNFYSQNKDHNYTSYIAKNIKENGERKKNNANYQYNLKNIFNQQNNDCLNYFRRNIDIKRLNDSTSYSVENNSKEIKLDDYNESNTSRKFPKKNIFSEKFIKNKNKEIQETSNNSNDTNILNFNNKNDIKNKENNYINNVDIIPTSNEDEMTTESRALNYKKLNTFLEKCKVKLNALDYEKILNIFKSFGNNSNIDAEKKIKKIINNNQKLCKLFDDLFFNQNEN